MTKKSIIPSLEEILDINLPDYEIPIIPDTKVIQSTYKRSPEAAAKLFNSLRWQIDGETRKGYLSFPARTDESVRENWLLNSQEISRTEAIYEYSMLLERIHQDTKFSYEEITEMSRTPVQHLDVLRPYMKELTTVLIKLNNTNSGEIANPRNCAIVTLMLQENLVGGDWTEDDTKALPQSFFLEILKYYNQNQDTEVELNNTVTEITEGESSGELEILEVS